MSSVKNSMAFLGFLLLMLGAHAQVKAKPELSAEDIAKKAFDQAMVGFKQGTATLRMVIQNAQGEKKDRTMSFKLLRGDDGLVTFLIQFERPADVKGMAFRVRERKGQLPDQFIYIPAAGAVKQVAAGNAAGAFFGSDFLYADLLPYPTDRKGDAEIKRLADEKLGDIKTYVIEVTPKVEGSPYGRLKIHVDQSKMTLVQIQFFDRALKPLKTMQVLATQNVEGKWLPSNIVMKNLQSKSSTQLEVTQINTKAKLSKSNFTDEAMQR